MELDSGSDESDDDPAFFQDTLEDEVHENNHEILYR